jgi:hypothetical protein
MIRLVIENVILFLMPAAVYVGYVMFAKRTGQTVREILDEGPLVWLFLAGIAFIAIIVLVFGAKGLDGEGKAGQVYVPPVYKDGQIIPGRVQDAPQTKP